MTAEILNTLKRSFGEYVLRDVEPLFREMQIEPDPVVGILRQPNLIRFVGGQKVPLRGQLAHGQQTQQHYAMLHFFFPMMASSQAS